ncbi:hypothetical protein WBG78_15720 [Chryseolinea sp. T2]|uniref:hypothetical protein n=1 Tax=Chryseolinea sp. T2 TaxID=3129255 RepID=UPI0030772037
MKVVLALPVLLWSTLSLAQVDKCKCVENTTDSFTGHRIVQTKFYTIGKTERSNSAFIVAVRRVDSVYFLHVISPMTDCVGPDTEVSFKTSAGQVISFNHFGDVDCGSTVVVAGASAHVNSTIRITVDNELVRKGGLSMVRVSNREHYTNVNLPMPMNLRTVFDCADVTFNKPAR